MTLGGMKLIWIEMEVNPLDFNSEGSEMCGMKSWDGPMVFKCVEISLVKVQWFSSVFINLQMVKYLPET